MEDWKLRIFYDGECSLCSREMAWLMRRTIPGEVDYVDICTEGFNAGVYSRTLDDFMREINAELPSGELISGMEVFRRLYTLAGLGWVLAPSGWPIIRNLFDWGYAIFAKNRTRISRKIPSERSAHVDRSVRERELSPK